MSAIDEFLEYEQKTKEAGVRDWWRAAKGLVSAQPPQAANPRSGQELQRMGVSPVVRNTAIMLGVAEAANLARQAILGGSSTVWGKASDAINQSRGYKAMIEHDPSLAEGDGEITRKAYKTLYKLNPEMAKDPLISSTFVAQVNSMGGKVSTETARSLVQARAMGARTGMARPATDLRGPAQMAMMAMREADPIAMQEQAARAQAIGRMTPFEGMEADEFQRAMGSEAAMGAAREYGKESGAPFAKLDMKNPFQK